jgi:hypothetical protein
LVFPQAVLWFLLFLCSASTLLIFISNYVDKYQLFIQPQLWFFKDGSLNRPLEEEQPRGKKEEQLEQQLVLKDQNRFFLKEEKREEKEKQQLVFQRTMNWF